MEANQSVNFHFFAWQCGNVATHFRLPTSGASATATTAAVVGEGDVGASAAGGIAEAVPEGGAARGAA